MYHNSVKFPRKLLISPSFTKLTPREKLFYIYCFTLANQIKDVGKYDLKVVCQAMDMKVVTGGKLEKVLEEKGMLRDSKVVGYNDYFSVYSEDMFTKPISLNSTERNKYLREYEQYNRPFEGWKECFEKICDILEKFNKPLSFSVNICYKVSMIAEDRLQQAGYLPIPWILAVATKAAIASITNDYYSPLPNHRNEAQEELERLKVLFQEKGEI